jgi:L-threonylcarbamoyladenylate synthase
MTIKTAERINQTDLFTPHGVTGKFHEIVERIKAGKIFAYPTETIYGIGGRADRCDVKKEIIIAKTREPQNPMILLAGNIGIFEKFGLHFPLIAKTLVKHFWPGKLTLILPYKNKKETIGVRVSGHPFIVAVNQLFDVPIYSTSANLSGQTYVNSPDEIYDLFKQKIDFMVDAGTLPPSPPSTVVNISLDNKIAIVREGAVETKKILSILENLLFNKSDCQPS